MTKALLIADSDYQKDQWDWLLSKNSQITCLLKAIEGKIGTYQDKAEINGVLTKVLWTPEGTPVPLSEVSDRYDYDVVISASNPGEALTAARGRDCRVFTVDHGMTGNGYGLSICFPLAHRSTGTLPEYYLKKDEFKKKLESHTRPNAIELIKTLPVAVQASNAPRSVFIKPNKVGLLIAAVDSVAAIKHNIGIIRQRMPGAQIVARAHPKDPRVIDLDMETDTGYKYDFIDSCEVLVGGTSSTMGESLLRRDLFQTGQRIYEFDYSKASSAMAGRYVPTGCDSVAFSDVDEEFTGVSQYFDAYMAEADAVEYFNNLIHKMGAK